MEKRKKIISKKLCQMESLLQLIEDLARTSDSAIHEISCATTLLIGLRVEIAGLLEEGD